MYQDQPYNPAQLLIGDRDQVYTVCLEMHYRYHTDSMEQYRAQKEQEDK